MLSGLLVINFAWVIQRLWAAQNYLVEKNQMSKASVYRRVRNLALIYAVVILAFTIQLLVYQLSDRYKRFLNHYWNYKWFLLDGLPFFAYLFLYLTVAYQLQPATYELLPQDESWLDNAGEIEMETFALPKFDAFGGLQGPSSRS